MKNWIRTCYASTLILWIVLRRIWMTRSAVLFLSLTASACWLMMPAAAEAQDVRLIRIGTGGLTGVYYPVGKLIARGVTGQEPETSVEPLNGGGVPGYIGIAQNSAGSVENVQRVVAGEIEAGIVQADVAAWGYNSRNMFEKNDASRKVRALASLYPEKLQIVVRRDAGVTSVNDLAGKRISVDESGSGTLAVMRILLSAHGMSEDDLQPVYLKPVFTHDKMVNGDLQGFCMMAGAPMDAVTQLLGVGINLVPVAPDMAAGIADRYPYLVPGVIPAGVYPGIGQTPTLQVHALLVVSQAMDDDLAYQITAALWSHQTLEILKSGHPQAAAILPETAMSGLSIPLHDGAAAYYRNNPDRFKDGAVNGN